MEVTICRKEHFCNLNKFGAILIDSSHMIQMGIVIRQFHRFTACSQDPQSLLEAVMQKFIKPWVRNLPHSVFFLIIY